MSADLILRNLKARELTSMSQSSNPKASENVHTNWDIPAHRQSVRSRCMSGESGGGAVRVSTGAIAAATGRERRGGMARTGMSASSPTRLKAKNIARPKVRRIRRTSLGLIQ